MTIVGNERRLIEKYNVQGPRYTSYPTALHFSETFSKAQILSGLKERNSEPRELSLYVHIPFCQSLCWYCGCNKVISRRSQDGSDYLDYLEREMALYSEMIHPESTVRQIHLGGGTPTFLNGDQIRRFAKMLHRHFTVASNVEMGIEIDPRTVTREQIFTLKAVGFNRASIGIQDLNEEVQIAIHRLQPYRQTANVMRWLRQAGFGSINFDLIYGLPKQTPKLFRRTLEQSMILFPDRFAVYSYAHVPWMKPSQKLIKEEDLPETGEKLSMLKLAIDLLTENGYRYIGMDHFAREDDELSIALENGTLQRNFQGYSTHAGLDIYAMGMSSISSIGPYYLQNQKDLTAYYEALDAGELPLMKAYTLTKDDEIRRWIIMQIMCSAGFTYNEMGARWNIDAKHYLEDEIASLAPMEADGLVLTMPGGLHITEKGRKFVRNIAMMFDPHITKSRFSHSYSKTV